MLCVHIAVSKSTKVLVDKSAMIELVQAATELAGEVDTALKFGPNTMKYPTINFSEARSEEVPL